MRFHSILPLTLAATSVAACAVATGDPSGVTSSDLIVTNTKGQGSCTTADLANNNGYVISNARVHVILWGFNRYGDVANEAAAVRDAFSTTATPSAGIQNSHFWQGPAMQYTDRDLVYTLFGGNNASPLYGATVDYTYDDTGLSGTSCATLTEAQIQAEVTYVNTHAVYPGGYKNADDLVMIAAPNCANMINLAGKHYWDATHGWAWAYVPYHPTDPENFIKTVTHEVTEAATNPYSLQVPGGGSYLPPTAGQNGWEQPSTSCEIGDLCQNEEFGVQTQSLAGGSAQTLTQTMWSNEVHDCVFSRAELGAIVGLGTDRRVWYQKIVANTTSSGIGLYGWKLLPSPSGASTFIGKPTVTSWGVNNAELAVLDSAGHMWKAQTDDGANSWWWDGALPPPTVNGTAYFFETADLSFSIPDTVSTGVGNFQIYAFAASALPGAIAPTPHLVRDGFDWGGSWTGWQEIQFPAYPASKISAASPMATQTGGYGSPISVGLSYIDLSGHIWLGTLSGNSTQPSWQQFYFGFGATPRSVDLAAYNPRRWEFMVVDTTGALWDCAYTPANAALGMTCTAQGTTPSGGFVGWPGVASFGDGRFVIAGQVAGSGANAAFLRFLNGSQSTAWNGHDANGNPNGTLVAGLDVVAF